jgi:uncharacterized protein (TIGR03083 family)
MSEWNFLDPASRANLSTVLNRTADELAVLAAEPGRWEAPTASGHWQVRDVVGHLVDTTEAYFVSFDAARGLAAAPEAKGLRGMDAHVDAGARRFREHTQAELLERLAGDRKRIGDVFETLTDDEWTSLLVPHGYMGPLPACFYPVFQLVDYAIHAWDIRQGAGRSQVLPADVADLLAPVCFVLWNYTVDLTSDTEPMDIGVRLLGREATTTAIAVRPDGVTVTPGNISGVDAVINFDPGSFVLTAFGRIDGGCAYGDLAKADRFLNSIFRI